MQILGLEKLSLVDYDGKVAATIFTGGCNFRCPFCHNATLVVDYKDIDAIPEEEILAYLKKRQGILEGLCITGGEPTLHKDLPLFMEKVKALGYAVKLDTNGTNFNMVKEVNESGLCDYFAMDIKNDKDHYDKIIGFDSYDTKNIQKTIDYFLSGKAKYEFRTTIINEFHKIENIDKIGQWIKGCDKYFMQKFKDSGNCMENGLSPVSDDDAKAFLATVRKYIPNAKLRGYDF